MQDKKNKFIVLILGIFASLIFLEIFLGIIGFIHLHKAIKDKIIKKEKDSYVVLCLGDSFTFGIGAQEDKSYPRQLEDLLNKEASRIQIKVVNRGIGGYNTAAILNKFDDYIKETNPDLITLLAGGANFWNAYGYSNYLNKRTLRHQLRDYLYNIKIFKLIKLLSPEIKNEVEHRAVTSIKTVVPSEVAGWYSKAYECEREGKYEEALLWHKKIIEKTPNFADSYHSIGRVYIKLGNRAEARQYFRKAIEIDPRCIQFCAFLRYIL